LNYNPQGVAQSFAKLLRNPFNYFQKYLPISLKILLCAVFMATRVNLGYAIVCNIQIFEA